MIFMIPMMMIIQNSKIIKFIQEMSDSNNNKALPPSKNITSKYGHLTITIQNLTFFTQNRQNFLIKLQFWGSSHPTFLPLFSSQTFTIIASLINFKTYLIDCKATQFQIVDNRNYKPIGYANLNWLPYLRALEDKQIYVDKQDNYLRDRSNTRVYYLPFFDETVNVNLPVYNSISERPSKKQEKIGQLTIKWQCRVYESDNQTKTASNINSSANLYNIRVSEISNRRNDNAPASICNIDLQQQPNQEQKINHSILSKRPSNSPKLYITQYPNMHRKSNVSIMDNFGGHLKKVREQTQVDQSKTVEKTTARKNMTNQLDLQLIRMRMEMEELVGVTNNKIGSVMLDIAYFQPIIKNFANKDLAHCDIRSQGKDKNSHWRIFPQSVVQQKIFFNSSLSIKPGSLLTFIIGMKKGKDTLKGSMPIDCIRDNYDVNIISSSGSVVGYLRVNIQRKMEINQIPQALQQKKIEKIQNIKVQPPKQTINNNPKIIKEPMRQTQNERQYQSKQPQSYFLFVIQSLKRSKTLNITYKVFDMNISQLNPQKIAFVPQDEQINKPLFLIVYQDSNVIYQQNLIKQLRYTQFASVNLTCSLIFQKFIPILEINCQLYVGNIQQINYFLQKIFQPQYRDEPLPQPSQQPPPQNDQPLQTQQSNKNSLIGLYQLGMKQQKRKMKTQIMGLQDRDRRLTQQKVSGESVALQKFQMNSQNQQNDDQNIYLVDLLTRFLDFLPQNILPLQVAQIPKKKFLEILTPHLKSSIFQIQLVDIIILIFQDISNQNINISQLIQCCKAYKSFYNIYHNQRQAILQRILQAEPKAAVRIRNNSEFGTLNDSIVWGRALSKIKDATIKQKLNKFYKISAFGTTDAALLIDDLQHKGRELRPLDIGNLGMLIKEWVQQFISNADFQKILNLKQNFLSSGQEDNYLNIRSVGDIIQMTLQLRLSLWQSLMLIQEIKGAYGCDLQLEEGVIGGPSLLSWIDGVRKRTNLPTDRSRSQFSQSQASLPK